MITAKAYQPCDAAIWNEIVQNARNGTLLFFRDFMDYHSDRFQDASLLFFDGDRPVGCLPMSRRDTILTSHGGLTFGGVVCVPEMRFVDIEAMLERTIEFAASNGCERLIYKPTPHIYHHCPSEEDLFCLQRRGARVVRTDLNTVVDLQGARPIQERRQRGARSAAKAGVSIEFDSMRFEEYWEILESTLAERHGLKPVHSCAEARLLKSRFPSKILLHTAVLDGQVIAGILTFDSELVVHAQYIAAGADGRETHALDLLFLQLLDSLSPPCRYFSFGISTFDEGRQLNCGLLEQKEGFGGRSLMQEIYELKI